MATDVPVPPTSELFNRRALAGRHPHLLSTNRIAWALRNRRTNGLDASGAIFRSASGEDLILEPAFLRWFLGLGGRAKPRARRRSAHVSAAS